ncbi:hypothetical protein SP5_077_00030 [Sphingomonas parapaucimobilis NBRC 15100]|uniref:Uncharacterized protein n=1 Tax=Sphingomonas parapaucimobilis NBRC 15100 TaxID=1219049 RepID=A0A0A1WA44_9SPHN|nr:hypothetical protein SP5_077_00030 [Sphingomonas parapaucimobilis NBRC 15100]
MRGNRVQLGARFGAGGTIPAGAGEPVAGIINYASLQDHPRGCGGTTSFDA